MSSLSLVTDDVVRIFGYPRACTKIKKPSNPRDEPLYGQLWALPSRSRTAPPPPRPTRGYAAATPVLIKISTRTDPSNPIQILHSYFEYAPSMPLLPCDRFGEARIKHYSKILPRWQCEYSIISTTGDSETLTLLVCAARVPV